MADTESAATLSSCWNGMPPSCNLFQYGQGDAPGRVGPEVVVADSREAPCPVRPLTLHNGIKDTALLKLQCQALTIFSIHGLMVSKGKCHKRRAMAPELRDTPEH